MGERTRGSLQDRYVKQQKFFKKIVLIGAGSHAHACIDVIEQCRKYSIMGLISENKKLMTKVLGYSLIGTDKELKKYPKKLNTRL